MGLVRMAYGAMVEQFAVLVKPNVGRVCGPERHSQMKRRPCGSLERDGILALNWHLESLVSLPPVGLLWPSSYWRVVQRSTLHHPP